jgi:hypothetical protein
MQKFESPARESFEISSHRDHATRPPQQRRKIFLLVLDVHGFVVILRVDDDRQIKLLRICP